MSYLEESARTVSPHFHKDYFLHGYEDGEKSWGLTAFGLYGVMATAELANEIKRGVFYGKGREWTQEAISDYIDHGVHEKSMKFGSPRAIVLKMSSLPPDLIHTLLGLASETGEFCEALMQGATDGIIDENLLKEELGDILWYVALGCRHLGLTMEEVMGANIAKLRVRFPEKFTKDHAVHRDLFSEQQALTGHQPQSSG